MELQNERPPAYNDSHRPEELRLPSVPQHDLQATRPTLPDLKTVLSGGYMDHVQPIRGMSGGLPRIVPASGDADGTRTSAEYAVVSPSEAGSVMSLGQDRVGRGTSVVSMEDPDVRMAAEALSGLGNPGISSRCSPHESRGADSRVDFRRSPPNGITYETPAHTRQDSIQQQSLSQSEREPILQLLTHAHPWVGGTINRAHDAYSTTKDYSPRIVQFGANLVERNVAGPVVNTVSSVSRLTGIDSGVRWYLGTPNHRSVDSDADAESNNPKRRRLAADDLESFRSPRQDALSQFNESVPPPYAPNSTKPPSYREEASPAPSVTRRPAHTRSLTNQVFILTSGLGVALSETSRTSLRACLHLLSQATHRVVTMAEALRMALEQYDEARDSYHSSHPLASDAKGKENESEKRPQTPDHDPAARALANLIKRHSDEIWSTLKHVVHAVSTNVGSALPDNARQYVRTQLMSLPARWRVVADVGGEGETGKQGRRMIAFAREGLEMMEQVAGACGATLESAEAWLARVGRGEGSATAGGA